MLELFVARNSVWHFFDLSNDTILFVTQCALALTLVTSIILTYIMIRYKGRRPVDNAVTLREVAFVLVLSRVFIVSITGSGLNLLALVIYMYLGLTMVALLVLTIREQWFPPPIAPEPPETDKTYVG